eukprot:m.141815 g.141815  ORF g.141815 m.141815 type:complete len:81 (+) comp14044_c0_seq1:1284-1526(+)
MFRHDEQELLRVGTVKTTNASCAHPNNLSYSVHAINRHTTQNDQLLLFFRFFFAIEIFPTQDDAWNHNECEGGCRSRQLY